MGKKPMSEAQRQRIRDEYVDVYLQMLDEGAEPNLRAIAKRLAVSTMRYSEYFGGELGLRGHVRDACLKTAKNHIRVHGSLSQYIAAHPNRVEFMILDPSPAKAWSSFLSRCDDAGMDIAEFCMTVNEMRNFRLVDEMYGEDE